MPGLVMSHLCLLFLSLFSACCPPAAIDADVVQSGVGGEKARSQAEAA